jgi:hypothetical protein
MGKQVVTARLDGAVVARLDEVAAGLGSSRTRVVEAAIASYLDDASRGVPATPVEAVRPAPVPGSVSAAFAERGPVDYAAAALERQRRLNAAKGRAS